MITNLERSHVHLELTRILNIPENPESDSSRRKAGLALAVSRYGGEPECSVVLAAADAIEDFTCGIPATFDVTDVRRVTGLDIAACEVVLMLIGAEKRSALIWSVENGEQVTLPTDLMCQWLKRNFQVPS